MGGLGDQMDCRIADICGFAQIRLVAHFIPETGIHAALPVSKKSTQHIKSVLGP